MGSNAVADDNDLDVSAQSACQRDQAAASERLVVWMRSDDHDAASPEDLIQIGYGECVGACEEFGESQRHGHWSLTGLSGVKRRGVAEPFAARAPGYVPGICYPTWRHLPASRWPGCRIPGRSCTRPSMRVGRQRLMRQIGRV